MSGKQIGYIRVSTVDQSTERQLHGISIEKVFEDKCSGKDTNRPELVALLEYVREGDTVHVHDISRMARNTEDLLSIVKTLIKKSVKLVFHKESLTFTGEDNPMQELMLTMLGGIYQFERSMMLERQREGIAIAKQKGRYKGKQINVQLKKDILALSEKGINKTQIANQLNCSRTTVYKALSS